jgi:glucose-1-phosphate adenylyltransferase
VPPEETHHFGTVTIDAGGRIREFVEKSPQPLSNMASMGIYVFNLDILTTRLREDAEDAHSVHDFGYGILPRMAKKDRVFGYRYDGYWQDIGTMEAYYKANMELLVKRPRFSLNSGWNILGESKILPAYMEKKEGIINSLISPGCVIRGRVENSILSPGVHIAEGAIISNSIVMTNASIGSHSIIDRCILDEETKVGNYCYIGFGTGSAIESGDITLIGKEVIVPDGTAIGRQCKLLPRVGPVEFNTKVVRAGTVLSPR